ncbi:MAG TPA: hypothetical protein VIV40_07530 [Kofleriaceae bacterium]
MYRGGYAWLFCLAACGGGSSGSDAQCTLDCAGTCNGSAVADRCGVCDTDPANDCWKGVHGISTLPEVPMFANLGSGMLAYSVKSEPMQQGLFYSGAGPATPAVEIAQTTPTNPCDATAANRGYMGLASVQALVDATSLTYDGTMSAVLFGTESSTCYRGLLVYKQNNLYGVLRFITINTDQTLDVEYWIGQQGVTDFHNAPLQ